jgi:hypothetical protein
MTTALQIIDRAYSLLGYKAAGEALSSDDADYALDALNAMMDGWNTQRLFIVSMASVVGTVSGASATVGPGLTFDTVRPVAVENGSFTRIAGIDYPVKWIDDETYSNISLKTVSATFPQYAYYDAGLPTATVYFYPVPNGPVEFHLALQVQLTAFADLATDYPLAPGYLKALQYSLAEELAPGVKELSMMVIRTAANARRAIRRSNVVVPQLDSGIINARFNIYSGL